MPGRSWRCPSSKKGLQVGAHDVFHPADSREAYEIVDLESPASPVGLEGLHGHVDADLVAMLETVGDRLLRGVDAYRHAVDVVRVNPFGINRSGKPEDADRRELEARRFGSSRNGHINLVGGLGSQFV